MSDFVHLHVHTQFSILDGACQIKRLIAKTKKDGMKAVAMTDHGNLFGAKTFYDTATAEGIKPIIGYEAYVAPKSRLEKTGKDERNYHLILLAKNETGYKNLCKLSSQAYIDGFYYRPRIDKEFLAAHSEGLIASSACIAGEVSRLIAADNLEEAEKVILWYKSVFKDDYYLELMRHKTKDVDKNKEVYDIQVIVNKALIEFSKKHNVKLIATNDCHFIEEEDAEAHDRLLCVNTGKNYDDPNRMKYTQQEFFKLSEEMAELFSDIPEAIENTVEIANKVEEYNLNYKPFMPDFPLPDGFTNPDDYLKHITYEGAAIRYPELNTETKERIDFELSVIKNMGFPGYFLIVWDFLNAARDLGVSVGPGRGSAAGSVAAYCLQITDIDPMKYDLLFERFLNPDRISMPDIDIDFDDDGRETVMKWVVDKYGKEKVAHIITFGTMAAKSSIRDVARVQQLPLFEANRLAKLVPEGPKISLDKAFKEVPELKEALDNGDENVRTTLHYAKKLEGSVRHTGVHACGVIIGKNDLKEHLPVYKVKDTELLVTQFDMNGCEEVGMLKMDFLGLKTLSIIKDAVKNVKKSTGKDIDISQVSLEDTKTFELYSKGDTVGIFQFESGGMQKYLKELKPNKFEDLIAMNALYRPGPMEYIPTFIKRKHGIEEIEYDLSDMEGYLKETYGITVYQEQVMLLSQKLANFTKGEADSLRKAMGKKKRHLMDQMKIKFDEGCLENGHDKKITDKVWTDWEAFAQYAFNKSHSTCYAYLSFQTAYLKANFPAEFMAAVLSRNLSDIKEVTGFIAASKKMGLSVLGPDLNESDRDFVVNDNGEIRFGLWAIKGVGEAAVGAIIRERDENGRFLNIFDFARRVDLRTVNKKCFESMLFAGAFDSLDDAHRAQYYHKEENESTTFLEKIIKYGNAAQNQKNSQQQSLFGEADETEMADPEFPECEKWAKMEKLKKEKEVTGFYISGHPLDEFKIETKHYCNTTLERINFDLKALMGKELKICGIVTEANHKTAKNGNPFGNFTIEDYNDNLRMMLFNENYLKFKHLLEEDTPLYIRAKIQQNRWSKEERIEINILSITLLSEVLKNQLNQLNIHLPLSDIKPEFVDKVESYVKEHRGKVSLKFTVYDPIAKTHIEMFSKKYKVEGKGFLNAVLENGDYEYKLN